MMGWCLYEIIYILAAGNVALLFAILIILNLFRLSHDIIQKIASLAFVSLFIVGAGVVVSESLISYFGTSNCEVQGNVSIISMILTFIVIVFVSIAIRKRKYVFNNKVDKVLSVLFILFIIGGISTLVWEGEFFDFIELLVSLNTNIFTRLHF